VNLTTIRLPDGTYRVNRWRMLEASAHAEQIERLWATHIGDNKTRMRLLADRILVRASTSASTSEITAPDMSGCGLSTAKSITILPGQPLCQGYRW
jgi:hypothetical protein